MSIVELVRLALSRIGSSRLRAALTMLGVIIGVASVVALVAVGQGATSVLLASGRAMDRGALLTRLIQRMEYWLARPQSSACHRSGLAE